MSTNPRLESKLQKLDIAWQVGRVEEARKHQAVIVGKYGKRSASYIDARNRVKKEESALVELVMKIFGESAS